MNSPKETGRPKRQSEAPKRRGKRLRVHPVDIHIGVRLRLRRVLLGMSQTDLGDRVGLTFQQVQKYERGANRISASRLYEFAKILDVPVWFFFDGIRDSDRKGEQVGTHWPVGRGIPEPPSDAVIARVVSAFFGIDDEPVQRSILSLMRALKRGRDCQAV